MPIDAYIYMYIYMYIYIYIYICVGNLAIIGSNNGLSTGPLGTNFSDILIEIHTFSFKKMHLKMSSGKWWLFCLDLNVLKQAKVMRSFDVFFDLRMNKQLSKQSWGWWFERPWPSLWRHCNLEVGVGWGVSLHPVGPNQASFIHIKSKFKFKIVYCLWLHIGKTAIEQ